MRTASTASQAENASSILVARSTNHTEESAPLPETTDPTPVDGDAAQTSPPPDGNATVKSDGDEKWNEIAVTRRASHCNCTGCRSDALFRLTKTPTLAVPPKARRTTGRVG